MWEKTYDDVPDGTLMYADMIPKLEADARGEFVEALRGAGLTGAKPAFRSLQPPGDDVEELLRRVDLVAQFAAVRVAHEALTAHGETPEWLGVLVRGYAHLAMLTQHHWTTATKVFTARAWLSLIPLIGVSPGRYRAWQTPRKVSPGWQDR